RSLSHRGPASVARFIDASDHSIFRILACPVSIFAIRRHDLGMAVVIGIENRKRRPPVAIPPVRSNDPWNGTSDVVGHQDVDFDFVEAATVLWKVGSDEQISPAITIEVGCPDFRFANTGRRINPCTPNAAIPKSTSVRGSIPPR